MTTVLLRGGTVLTMDDHHTVVPDGDVLIDGDKIAAVGQQGQRLDVPEGTQVVDASGGIVMPGMIDTHRHMWQTAMRGYGADWTLTQYFVWYYLEHGKTFRPEDIHAGNLTSACSTLCSPCDQSTVVVMPASSDSHAEVRLPAWMSSGRKVLPCSR